MYVQETIPTGWTLTDISCTGNGAVVVIGRGGSGAFVNGGTKTIEDGDNTVQVTVDAGDIADLYLRKRQGATLDVARRLLDRGLGSSTYRGDGSLQFLPTTVDRWCWQRRNARSSSLPQFGHQVRSGDDPDYWALTNIAVTLRTASTVGMTRWQREQHDRRIRDYDDGDNTVKRSRWTRVTPPPAPSRTA